MPTSKGDWVRVPIPKRFKQGEGEKVNSEQHFGSLALVVMFFVGALFSSLLIYDYGGHTKIISQSDFELLQQAKEYGVNDSIKVVSVLQQEKINCEWQGNVWRQESPSGYSCLPKPQEPSPETEIKYCGKYTSKDFTCDEDNFPIGIFWLSDRECLKQICKELKVIKSKINDADFPMPSEPSSIKCFNTDIGQYTKVGQDGKCFFGKNVGVVAPKIDSVFSGHWQTFGDTRLGAKIWVRDTEAKTE